MFLGHYSINAIMGRHHMDLEVNILSFNIGFYCKECGPVKESKQRSINKVKQTCCKICGGIVTKWERPLNERIGRCRLCGHGSFKQAMHKGDMIIKCKQCGQVSNPDTGEILSKGDERFEYKPTKTK